MYNESLFSSVIGMVIGFLAVFGLIFLIIGILIIVAYWKMFTKAKEEGWKSIIPVYNNWTMCKIVGLSPYWIIELFAVSYILNFVSSIIGYDSVISGLLALVAAANSIYFLIIFNISIAKSYGKDNDFAVLLIFLPIIGYPILGFGKAQYLGPNPCNDPVMKFILDTLKITDDGTGRSQTINTNTYTQSTPTTSATEANVAPTNNNPIETNQPIQEFCPKCGNKLNNGDIYCQRCGTKVN